MYRKIRLILLILGCLIISCSKDNDNDNADDVSIDVITISDSCYNVGCEESYLDLSVRANVEFDTHISVDWIHEENLTSATPEADTKLTFKVEENKSTDARIGIITFEHGSLSRYVKIVQDGWKPMMDLVISHEEINYTAPEFIGDKASGTVEWGDGSTSNLEDSHSFTVAGQKVSTFKTTETTGFVINSLSSISSITIYNDSVNR